MGDSRASKNVIYKAMGKTKLVAETVARGVKMVGEVGKAFARNAVGRDVKAILSKNKK